jgi:hypothetical protein
MTAGELIEWQAYERVFGSILVHERIDAGFAQVSLLLAKAYSDKGARYSMRDFMPPWYRDLTADQELTKGMGELRALVDDANN